MCLRLLRFPVVVSDLFKTSRAVKRHRSGLFGKYQDEYAAWLSDQSYSFNSIVSLVGIVTRFNEYLYIHNIRCRKKIVQKIIDLFVTERVESVMSRRHLNSGINRFLCFLREKKRINIIPVETPKYQKLLDRYIEWMVCRKGAAPATQYIRRRYMINFISLISGPDVVKVIRDFSSIEVQTVYLQYAKGKTVSARRHMQSTLRTFFQFCYLEKITKRDLSRSIPTLRTYRLSTVPRSISEEDAINILHNIDRKTIIGKRDYAILTLLYCYGVRRKNISDLRFQDVDWRNDIITFSAIKSGRDIVVPIVPEAGKALLDYIENGRPNYPCPVIFLTKTAPCRKLSAMAISPIVRSRMRAANITQPTKGAAHLFRHRFATRLLEEGASLKEISDLLGHRKLNTTMMYTKVDIGSLHQVALELP